MKESLSIWQSEEPFFHKHCMIKVTESQCEIEHHCFQGRAYSHWWMAFSHWVKLPVNDMACLCWQAGDKDVPSGISCHSFSLRKAAESSYLFFFFFSVEHLSSFGWIEKFTTTKPSPLIKSAAKPSTTKEHNIWGRWVIPLLNLEAGTEFQMSIIERWKWRTHTNMHAHTAHAHIRIHILYCDENESVIDHQPTAAEQN